MGSSTSEVKRSVASHEDVEDPRFEGRLTNVRPAEPCEMSCELLCDENGVGDAEFVEFLDEQIVLFDTSNRPHTHPVQRLFG